MGRGRQNDPMLVYNLADNWIFRPVTVVLIYESMELNECIPISGNSRSYMSKDWCF
jgi:hypothetical protein